MYYVALTISGTTVIQMWRADSWDEVVALIDKIGPISGTRQLCISEMVK